MELLGTPVYHQSLRTLFTLLAPIAPHIASDLWEKLVVAGERLHIAMPEVCNYMPEVCNYIRIAMHEVCNYI